MGTTANYALRYPALTDTPDGATQLQNLADDVDAALLAAVSTQWIKPVFARKTADEARASVTTLADDGPTGGSLALPGLAAGAIYKVEGIIVYDGGADTSAGFLKWAFSVPASSSGLYSFARENESATYAGAYPSGWTTANTANTTGVTTAMSVTVHGMLVVGSAGTLKFRWAQDSSKSTNTHVRANSWLSALRIA